MIKDPAFNYDQFGQTYAGHRKTDPRIAKYIFQELESAQTVLNVGAGAGSYEPEDKYLVAVEPSEVMRGQRIKNGKRPAINAKADLLPFDDKSFDAVMATVTIHHWPDIEKGLSEMKRVARQKVLIMTFDPDALHVFWNAQYFGELIEIEKARYPAIKRITAALGNNCRIITIPVPFDCTDGFQEAFYGRPEAFMQKEVRLNQSAWGFLKPGQEDVLVRRLEKELTNGDWEKKFGHHRRLPFFEGALRLIVADI